MKNGFKTLLMVMMLCLGVVTQSVAFNVVTASAYCGGHANSSMSFKVKKVKGNERNAQAVKAQLMKIEGVSAVNYDLQTGIVTVEYNKEKVGCCSKLTSSLKDNGWKYSTVSAEASKTKGTKACEPKSCPASKAKGV